MVPHAHLGQPGDGGGDVDRVAAQPVQLGDDQHVILLELVQKLDEAGPRAMAELPDTVSECQSALNSFQLTAANSFHLVRLGSGVSAAA